MLQNTVRLTSAYYLRSSRSSPSASIVFSRVWRLVARTSHFTCWSYGQHHSSNICRSPSRSTSCSSALLRMLINGYCWWPSRSLLPSWFWSSQQPQSEQRSALPCIYEFWHAFYLWASFTVHHRWKTSQWSYTSAMETWALSGMGCYLSRHLYAQSAIHENTVQAGSAALKAELNKSRKYADNIAGVDFIPFAIETSGVWACRPWSWYPRLIDVWHQRCMNHVLQPFFANVSRWLWCEETPNAFWGHSGHPIVDVSLQWL